MTTSEEDRTIVQVWPESLIDITEAVPDKFMIKFSSDNCVPCQKLQKLLDDCSVGNLKKMHVFQIKVGDARIYADLRRFFKFRTLPFCVVTNKSLDCIETMCGFTEATAFEEFVQRHF